MLAAYYICNMVGDGSLDSPFKAEIDSLINIEAGEYYETFDHPKLKVAACKVIASKETHDKCGQVALCISPIVEETDLSTIDNMTAPSGLIEEITKYGISIIGAHDTYGQIKAYIIGHFIGAQL